MQGSITAPSIEDIYQARQRLAPILRRTPLVRLHTDALAANVYLKLENLQPIGSFKLRGAGNAMLQADIQSLQQGVYTASAGNMAQGVAWHARRMEVPCEVVVPDHAPQTKLDAIAKLGAKAVQLPFDQWWQVIIDHHFDGARGKFVHPVSDPAVMAGNGTIGLEILEDLPDVDAVLVPFGGGGLICGIASAIRALKPGTRVYACEVQTAAPLSASLQAGRPVGIPYQASFVDGIGGRTVLAEMWPLVRQLVDGSLVVTLDQVGTALRMLVQRNRLIAEGAGAVPVAAALRGDLRGGNIVCVVSGGNIDLPRLMEIIQGASDELKTEPPAGNTGIAGRLPSRKPGG